MTRSPSPISRIVTAAVVALAAISIAACDGSRSSPTAIPPPENPPTEPNPLMEAYFFGDATVESVSGHSFCAIALRAGDHLLGMRWDEVVVQNGTFLIAYDAFWVNGYDTARYEGTLNGLEFADDYRHPEYPNSNCQFRESSISGTFAADFRSFELRETMVFGPPGREHRIVTFHRAARR